MLLVKKSKNTAPSPLPLVHSWGSYEVRIPPSADASFWRPGEGGSKSGAPAAPPSVIFLIKIYLKITQFFLLLCWFFLTIRAGEKTMYFLNIFKKYTISSYFQWFNFWKSSIWKSAFVFGKPPKSLKYQAPPSLFFVFFCVKIRMLLVKKDKNTAPSLPLLSCLSLPRLVSFRVLLVKRTSGGNTK